jgi:hypothetical protein
MRSPPTALQRALYAHTMTWHARRALGTHGWRTILPPPPGAPPPTASASTRDTCRNARSWNLLDKLLAWLSKQKREVAFG